MRLDDICGRHDTGPARPLAKFRQLGLTLIELLVALVVLAITVTWAVPSFRSISARNEVAIEVLRIKTAMATARSNAVTRGTTITVCPSADQATCTNDDWSGPLVVVDG